MESHLQPLRIPHGWHIQWNTLFEEDPTEPANANGYYYGGTNLFFAVNEHRRLAIDIAWWTPRDKPNVGCYRMQVLRMVEADPMNLPRRKKDRQSENLEVNWDEPAHAFGTVPRLELVDELEAWLGGHPTTEQRRRESSKPERLFVYGTLRKDANHAMHEVLARYSSYVSEGRIWAELYYLGRYPSVSIPTACESFVVGEVYEFYLGIAAQAWRELDEYEGCAPTDPQPHEYERRLVRVMLADDTETDAWAYVLRAPPTGAVRIVSGDYLAWRQQQR